MANDKVVEEPKPGAVVINLLIVEGMAAIISNMLVIIPIIREKRLRKINYMPLLSLATADTISGIVLITTALTAANRNIKLTTGFIIFGQGASILNMIVVCTDRWVAIFQPLRYRVLLHSKRLAAMTIGTWLIAAVITVPIAFFDKFQYLTKPYDVPQYQRIYIIVLCSIFICICTILGYMQFRIICTVRHHLKRILPLTEISVAPAPSASSFVEKESRDSIQSNGHKIFRRYFKQREITLAVATNCVYLLIIITSSPFLIVTLLLLSYECPDGCEKLLPITIMLLHINIVINPIIYAMRLTDFRSAICRIFDRFRCCQV